jgi:hypothetical protein
MFQHMPPDTSLSIYKGGNPDQLPQESGPASHRRGRARKHALHRPSNQPPNTNRRQMKLAMKNTLTAALPDPPA